MALVQHPNRDRQLLSTSTQSGHQHNSRLLDSVSSRLNQVLEFPIHGSCSRCHHLHTNKALHLPLDPQKHTRINCDQCEHPILGIGRTSTQTTLASIETNPVGNQSLRHEPIVASSEDHQFSPQSVQSPPLRVDTSGNSGQLSTITEGVSPAQPSSAVLTPPVPGDSRSERSASPEWILNQHVPGSRLQETAEREVTITNGHVQASPSSKPSDGSWVRLSQRRLHDRIRRHLQKPRSFNIKKLGLHVDVSPAPSVPGRRTPRALIVNADGRLEEEYNVPPTSEANPERRVSVTTGTSTPVRTNAVSVHSIGAVQQPTSAHPDPLIGRTPTTQEKNERIRARRREATLKRQAELISRCECQSECQCRVDSVRSNAASLGPEPSNRSIQVPAHPLGHLLNGSSESSGSRSSNGTNRGAYLFGVGSHLHASGHVHSGSDGWANGLMEGPQVFSDRLSQTSTVYVRSNGSSASISSRRPPSLRRSSTTPASLARRSADGFRFDFIEHVRSPDSAESHSHQQAPSRRREGRDSHDSDNESLSAGPDDNGSE